MSTLKIAAAILVAGLVGAGAMLFLAPTSGKRMRGRVKHRGMELRNDMMDRADELRENAQKVLRTQNHKMTKEAKRRMDYARSMTGDLSGTAQQTYAQTRKRVSREAQRRMDDARAMANDLQDRSQQIIAKRQKKASRWATVGRLVMRVL